MAGKKTLVGQLANAIVKRHPKAGSLTLAKMLRKESPAVFTSVEQARCAVRFARGAGGLKRRKYATCPRSKEEAEQCRTWGALLPDPAATTWGWRELPRAVKRWLIIADLHIPYHDKTAVAATLQQAEGQCDGILLLGDLVDAYQLSSFCRDPRKRGFEDEVDTVARFFDALDAFPGIKAKVWKAGNHEMRLERYLMQRAPDLPKLCEEFSYRTQLELDARGIVWINAQDPIRHHQLAIIHGHEWGNRFASPVNAARGAFLKAHECTLEGHGHRTSEHAEATLFGTTIHCWSLGCLCSLHPEYRPLGTKWNHGFAYLNTGSEWSVTNHTIIGGKVL